MWWAASRDMKLVRHRRLLLQWPERCEACRLSSAVRVTWPAGITWSVYAQVRWLKTGEWDICWNRCVFAIFSLSSIIIINARLFLILSAPNPVSVSHIGQVSKVWLNHDRGEQKTAVICNGHGFVFVQNRPVTHEIIKLYPWHFFLWYYRADWTSCAS